MGLSQKCSLILFLSMILCQYQRFLIIATEKNPRFFNPVITLTTNNKLSNTTTSDISHGFFVNKSNMPTILQDSKTQGWYFAFIFTCLRPTQA